MKERHAALVTGASRNIGRAICMALAEHGTDIAVHVGSDSNAAQQTADAVAALGAKAVIIAGDLSDPQIARRIVDDAADAFGRLDIVVNNAAIRPEAAFDQLEYAQWRRVMAVNLDAVFLVSQAALPFLRKSGNAAIVNIGGLTGHSGASDRAHVIASKAGVVGLTKAMAHDLAAFGVTVNCVAPGLIATERKGGANPRHHDSRKNLVGRPGTAREIGDAVAFLCSRQARYITGTTLHVNGGAYLA